MSNPGPASVATIHPSNLATNQALRLIAYYPSVNLNAVEDSIAPILDTAGNVSAKSVIVANASASLTTAQLAVYTGAGATGTAVKSAYALSGNTSSAKVVETAVTSTDLITGNKLYIRCTTPQGAAATADVYVYGYDLSYFS